MAVSIGSKCVVVGVMFLITVISGALPFVLRFHWETKALMIKAHIMTSFQLGLVLLSMFVWTSFKTVFEPVDHLMYHVPAATPDRRFKTKSNQFILIKRVVDIVSQKQCLIGKCLLLFYLFLCHFSYFTEFLFIGEEPYLAAVVCYTALGSLFQLVIGLCFIKLVGLCGKYVLKKRFCMSSKFKVMFAVAYAFLISSYGFYNAMSPPTVKTVTVPLRGLPHRLEGFTIVQLSDIYLGPTVGRQKMQTIVDISNQLNPDILVLTGDLVDGSVAKLKQAAEPLIDVRSKHGKYFISGNHEYYTGDVDNWFSYLKQLGFTVLHNSNVKLPRMALSANQICLAGTDDLQAAKIGYGNHGMDLKKALGTCKRNQPTILLAHQPKAAKIALDSKHRVDLVLSGHTHGGQMFPFMIAAYMINPFFAGLYEYGKDSHVYVSMGTQYWGIPMRILSTMEITQLILTRKH